MNQLLKTEPEIIAWLNRMDVENYTLVPHSEYGLVVDVGEDVRLSEKKLSFIAVKFRHVLNGHFECDHNHLTSLLGCPDIVGCTFDCSHNHLTSLRFGPQSVGGTYQCAHNALTSLEGCALEVGAIFFCNSNSLVSLEGCPQMPGWGSFNCFDNPALGVCQEMSDRDLIYQTHQEILRIEAEQNNLSTTLLTSLQTKKNYKI